MEAHDDGRQCRVCARPACSERGPLLVPCCCIGSSRYAHSSCLNQQRLRDGLLSESFWGCSVCGADYRMKAYGQILRMFTSWPAIVGLTFLCSFCVVLVASAAFQLVLPFLSMMMPGTKKDGDEGNTTTVGDEGKTTTAPFVLKMYMGGVDFGYWVGGLLMITFGRKLWMCSQDHDYCSLMAYVTFVPTLLSFTEADGVGNMAWVMLPIYSYFNTSFMVVTVFNLMKGLSSLVVREQVVDFVGLTAENDQLDTNAPDEVCCDNDNNEFCLCCWDFKARYAMNGCGHLIACDICRRRMIYRQLKLSSHVGVVVPRMRLLTNEHLNETKVKCPLCRKLDVMIEA